MYEKNKDLKIALKIIETRTASGDASFPSKLFRQPLKLFRNGFIPNSQIYTPLKEVTDVEKLMKKMQLN